MALYRQTNRGNIPTRDLVGQSMGYSGGTSKVLLQCSAIFLNHYLILPGGLHIFPPRLGQLLLRVIRLERHLAHLEDVAL